MAYRTTFLSASSTAAQRRRAPRNRVAITGSKLKGGLMFGVPLELGDVLAPLPDWDDAQPSGRTASGKGGANLHVSRHGKGFSRRNQLPSSTKRRGRRTRGGSRSSSNRITRSGNRRAAPKSGSARGEVSAPVADFDNISDVTGVSSNAISSDHDSQTSSQAHKIDSSTYDMDGSSSLSPSGSSAGSSPDSLSSARSTPPGSRLLPRWSSTKKLAGVGDGSTAGYLRHTSSSARKHAVPGAAKQSGVQSIHISRRGSIHIDRPLGLASVVSTSSKRGKKSRGSSTKKKKRLKKNRTSRKMASTKPKNSADSRPALGAASPVDEIVESIERKLKGERKRMMKGMDQAKKSDIIRQTTLKRVSDAAAYADRGGRGVGSANREQTEYFWSAGSAVARRPPPRPATRPGSGGNSGGGGTAAVTAPETQQKRHTTATREKMSAVKPPASTGKADAGRHPNGAQQPGGSPHKIKIHRDGSVDIKFQDDEVPRRHVASQKKSVAFAYDAAAHPLHTVVENSLSGNPKSSSSSSSSSASLSSFRPTSALDEGLREERKLQEQSLRNFWAERKENLARVDTILYGDGNRRSQAGIIPGLPNKDNPGSIQNRTLAHAPSQSSSPPPPPPPTTVQEQLRAYTDGLGLDNAVAKLEQTNMELNAQLLSQRRDMATIQEEMRGVTERALASSAELRDIKRREQDRIRTAELRAAEDAAKRAEDAAEVERRAALQLRIMEQNQRALSAQQAQKQRRTEGAQRAIAKKRRAGPTVRRAQASPIVITENQRPRSNGMMPTQNDIHAPAMAASTTGPLFNLVAEWMVWAQECMVDQVCSSMGVAKEQLLAFRMNSTGGSRNDSCGVPPPVPFPAHFTERLRAFGDTSVVQPAARRLERTCAHIAAFMSMREKSRQQQFRTGMQNSRMVVTKAKRVTEAESKRKIAALISRHDETLKELKMKAAKAVEAAGRERTEAVEASKQRVTLAEEKADKSYRRGREEGDYELGRQKEKHAAEMAEMQAKVVQLTNTLNGLQNRIAELENEARPEALASAMQRVVELEDALDEATEETRLGVEAQRQCEEDCADRVVRARAEHDRRLLAMRNAHEQRLTIIQSKMTQLSAEHAALLQRVKDEGVQRARDAEAKVRREVERAALSAGINLRGEMDAKLNRAKAKHRVEVQRLRRMLARASRLGGDVRGGDSGAKGNVNCSKHEDVDASVGGLMGYEEETEWSGEKEEEDVFRIAGMSESDSLSSSEEVEKSVQSLPQKSVEDISRDHAEGTVSVRPILGAGPGLLREKNGLPGLERSGIDLINDSGLTSVNVSTDMNNMLSSSAASPIRTGSAVRNELDAKAEPQNEPAATLGRLPGTAAHSQFQDVRTSRNGSKTISQSMQRQLNQNGGVKEDHSVSSYSRKLEAYLLNEGTRSSQASPIEKSIAVRGSK